MLIDRRGLAGKRILLTGGTTGIGRATLALLAADGARVLTFGRDRAALDDALDDARARVTGEGEVSGLTADVATRAGIDAVFAAVPYCLDLIGAARIETDPARIVAFRPKG